MPLRSIERGTNQLLDLKLYSRYRDPLPKHAWHYEVVGIRKDDQLCLHCFNGMLSLRIERTHKCLTMYRIRIGSV